ncbi:PP2C-like domain-containing protein CG9801 [Cimex lectularius]|uniref:PPM-type phosphatase domain-containing protein n=1 Tax=Cimex lectularius TaxID=79782 RepID=A0A8I6RM37_CIMLE|nr:PP2C-like domain-containing protein CG9801 [Cimex lectularius]
MMPGFRQKVAGFIRQLSNQQENRTLERKQPSSPKNNECFIQKYLNGHETGRDEPKIIHGQTPQQLPPKAIGSFSKPVISALTGPNGGLTTVNRKRRHLSISDPDVRFIDTTDEDTPSGTRDANSNTSTINCNLLGDEFTGSSIPLQKCESTPNARDFNCGEPVAGVINWELPTASAYGKSVSLYERHPVTGVPAGEPIADCFAIVARRDSAILSLADGVNWGPKASLAAKAAVHGCVDYLNQAVYNHRLANTTDAFVALLRSFNAAHNLILEEKGMLTTLTAVLILPLTSPSRYIACACNVGDSLAYVYSAKYGVREITQGSHDVHRMRDMRDAMGALGPVDGTNPELANLTCAMTEVEVGDIVFITSDGVSDNLDPVVGKFTGLSGVEAEQRHRLGLLRIDDLLRHGVSGHGPPCSTARGVVDLMIDFVTRLTSAKRRLLEDADLYSGGGGEGQGRAKRKQMCGKLAAVPGKLDHATVVAYKVGQLAD